MSPGATAVAGRRRPTPRALPARLLPALLLLASALGAPAAAPAQEGEWSGRLLFEGRAVRDAANWLALGQEAALVLEDGRRFGIGTAQTRRFGTWDASLDAGATLRPGGSLYLSLDGRVTPDAEIVEDARLGARAALPLGELVPSLGYRFQAFEEGAVHTVSPGLEWYAGSWLVSGELRIVRSAVETVNLAAIGRLTRRLSDGWIAWVGAAAGEEDFLVGRPPARELRTLTTRTLTGGVERALGDGWSARLSATAVDSDPRLDRIGSSLTLVRAF